MGARALSPGVKRPGHETDPSLPSNVKVKNGGAIPPLPHMSSWCSDELIKHRDNFAFFTRLCVINYQYTTYLYL
jgi:hypothetical protein